LFLDCMEMIQARELNTSEIRICDRGDRMSEQVVSGSCSAIHLGEELWLALGATEVLPSGDQVDRVRLAQWKYAIEWSSRRPKIFVVQGSIISQCPGIVLLISTSLIHGTYLPSYRIS
jgi:hypothetical protein